MPYADWAIGWMKRRADTRRSVRRRLLQLLIVPIALVLIIGATVQAVSSADPIRQAYDSAMADAALALALNVQVSRDGHIDAHVSQETLNILRTDTADQVFYQILAPDGTLLAGEADLQRAAGTGGNLAYQMAEYRGNPIRLMTYRSRSRAGMLLITIAETLNKRARIRARIVSTAMSVNVVALILVLACVWLAVRRALRPVDDISDQIANRSSADLMPLPEDDVPLELRGVVARLNSLFRAIKESGRAERDFLDSAAHQLRTPLTGLLAQLELLAAEEQEPSRKTRLDLARDAAQRLSRTTGQLLALARSGHQGHAFVAREDIDLALLARTAVSNHVQRAAAAGIDLGAELEPARTRGIPWLLTEALGNLLDNALIYTPAGGSITVRTGSSGDGAWLEVVDSGIGIPESERDQVLSRFHRGTQSRGSGSGLGLSIVAEVAHQHGARLSIAAAGHDRGTRIRLEFPVDPMIRSSGDGQPGAPNAAGNASG